jgi:hypothetical protein
MGLGARIVDRNGTTPKAAYRWDAETDILSGEVKGVGSESGGLTGSVELEGNDGSFILLDVHNGSIRGVEVVVWPDVRTVATLQVPSEVKDGDVTLPTRRSQPSVAAVEVDAAITIETNTAESVFHVRVGAARRLDVIRVADGLLVEVDDKNELAGLWLTGVPTFPAEAELE